MLIIKGFLFMLFILNIVQLIIILYGNKRTKKAEEINKIYNHMIWTLHKMNDPSLPNGEHRKMRQLLKKFEERLENLGIKDDGY